LLKDLKLRSILIFCSTKTATKQLSAALKKLRLNAEEIHSDLDQPAREKVLNRFRSKELNILVATDIVSRGIDIEDIDMVVNFDVPNEGEDYIHRIGRTARAQAKGAAITLINEKDQAKFATIEKLLGKAVYKGAIPVHLGDGPVFDPKKHPGKFRRSGPGKRR
jgi:superfamily II DNA/RNA helicase